MSELVIEPVGPDRAVEVVGTIHGSFAGRPVLDPPATALDETEESVRDALTEHGGLLAVLDGEPVGALLFRREGDLLGLRRVGVLPGVRHHGVAPVLTARAAEEAAARGCRGLILEARAELPETVAFWRRQGYVEIDADGPRLTMLRLLASTVTLPLPEDTQACGRRIGEMLRRGDLVILSGDLGAGKTTFTQGLAEGLGVRGPITSPTFVIARVHPSLGDGPALVHVDAYRLGEAAELDDLDLDTDMDEAVTVVEWGAGLAEALSGSRLMIDLHRGDDDVRTATLTPIGERWRHAG